MVKSGFKTSEFYLTLIPLVISGLVLSGVVPSTDSSGVEVLLRDCIAGIVSISALISYIFSRTQIKVLEKELEIMKVEEALG